MVTDKNPRQYEVSLWTLQDSFITVLKGYNTDNFGTIKEPSMEVKDDSEDTFSFKLPMYIREEGEFKENPNWYNVTNGNLIINLRKVKVIFYKGTDRQAISEFVITKVEESHEGFEKYCSVDCEGLAFNELGKTGYNIELSQDLYELECEEGIAATEVCEVQVDDEDRKYIQLSNRSAEPIRELTLGNNIIKESEETDKEYNHRIYLSSEGNLPSEIEVSYKYAPLNTIQYWIEKVLPADYNWEPRINMDWTDYYEDQRKSDRLYEAAYIENWELKDNILVATSAAEAKEKFRIVEESGSNRYNLTQTIAETFGVFVRYIYEYDDNLYITNRIVEFYNSSLKEQEDALDFTYYYDTEELSREMDSADQISKMYVLTGSGDDMLTSSITEVEANKSLENYLFNFEYLHDTGAIDDEQYNYIDEYEAIMHNYNKQLQELESRISVYEETLVEFEASRDNAHVAAAAAEEAMEGEQAYVRHLLNSDKTDYDKNPETLSMTGGNPAYSVIIDDTETDSDLQKHCAIRSYGVLPNSIIAFLTLNDANNFFTYMYGGDSALVEIRQDGNIYHAVQKESGNFITYNSKWEFDTEAEANLAAQNWVLTNKIVDPQTGATGYLPSWQYLVDINPETGFAEGLKQIQCDDSQTGLFLTYDYSLDLYHKTLAEQWQQEAARERDLYDKYSKIVDKIDGPRDENDEWTSSDHGLLQECRDKQQEILQKKQELILDLENYLGPALREGTWQPDDDYARYGDRRSAEYTLTGNSSFPENQNIASIGWDKNLFDYEETNYEEDGFNQQKVYYPCIRLTNDIIQAISEKVQDEDSNITMLDIGYVWDDTVIPGINPLIIATGNNPIPLEYPQIFRIGSESQIAFLKSKTDEQEPVFPVLMLTNAASYCSTFDLSKQTGASQTEILQRLNGSIGILSTKIPESGSVEVSYVVEPLVNADDIIWIADNELATYDVVYPRIKIPYRNFVNNTLECTLSVNDNLLLANRDWNIRGRYDINNNITSTDLEFWAKEDSVINSAIYSYYVTIDPEALIREGIDISENFGDYYFSYKLSNTGLAIYLDAIEVMKENSVPKVTYSISPVILKTDFMEEAYNKIHRIIHINDPELKFKEVSGYISGLTLDLDHPWEDEIEVQNYTSKFEDLFSSIVASTASIKKNIVGISAASQAFVNTGEINEATLQKTLENSNVILRMNNDHFIIGDTGIKAYSDDGIVHYSDKGIFTANEKNDDGSWKWNTSILPSGISANAITTGQLDTNLIRIYSGDDLRFQMNSDGLFAYKSWFSTDLDSIDDNEDKAAIKDEITRRDGLDPAQYVVMNSDGLFLHAKKGAYIFDSDTQKSTKVEYDIDRVEISWDGLILRNNQNQKTFYADPDTGNLNITGNLRIKTKDNTIAELTDSKLRFGDYELVKTEKNGSECLSFVYYFSEGGD